MISGKAINKILEQVKQAASKTQPAQGASAQPKRGIAGAIMAATQQAQPATGSDAARKKRISDAMRKAAGAVARPLTLKKGGMAKKSTVKAKARKK